MQKPEELEHWNKKTLSSLSVEKKWQQVKIGKHNRKMNFSYPGPPKSKILAFLLVLYLHQSKKKRGDTEFIDKLISSSYFDSCLDATCI